MIGIFDSGLGGLTVYKDVAKAFPKEAIVYIGDTARVPYGPRGKDTVIDYSRQMLRFLVKRGVDVIVVACNTASALALPEIKKEFSLPIIGVIEPTAKIAVKVSRHYRIGVIGTKGTIKSGQYEKIIHQLSPRVKVFSQPCPLLVPIVEEGLIHHPVAEQMVRYYLKPLISASVDTIILGCTHYPLLAPTVRKVVGGGVRLISSGKPVVARLKGLLSQKQLMSDIAVRPRHLFYSTDDPQNFKAMARMFTGQRIAQVKLLPLSKL